MMTINSLSYASAILIQFFALIIMAQEPHKTVVWHEKEDGNFAHFVYGLTATRKGTILAFAEARINDGKDDSAHHIVLKRSIDKGLTFSPSQILAKSKNGESYTNPTVVEDKSTGNIFLFYAQNFKNDSTSVFFIKSNNDGLHWSTPTEITQLFNLNKHNWTFHLPGPGQGIQLKDKRLVVPIWHRKSIRFKAAERNYGVNCLYSDDHGKTWQLGGDTPVGEFNESQLIEQKNGGLLLLARTINSKDGSHQAKVWSKDRGKTWSQDLIYVSELTGPACDIGLVSYRVKSNNFLVSQPSDLKKRRDLTIRLSLDGGESWKTSRLLEPGPATYSDIAVLPDKTIICLYGHGGVGHMPKTVSLARFSYNWLTQSSQ